MKSFILASLSAYAFSTVLAACGSPVTLTGNVFATRTLHANSYYADRVAKAAIRITDSAFASKAAKFGGVGTFVWISAISAISTIDYMIKAVPCDEIIGLVIYNLPGRDCGSGASRGELPAGSIGRYKTEYIDRIRRTILANPNTAIVLIIEPDALPHLVTRPDLSSCKAASQGYKDGIVYALTQLNLPNVVMYIDAGNGGWLDWVDNLAPGADLIDNVTKAAGSPSQVKGIATNVSNWGAWSKIPGEFERASDGQNNTAQDEQRYIHLLGAELATRGVPNHAIMDTSRNGVSGIRSDWSGWCNVRGAGFGVRPTSNTGDDLLDAFVWVKPGGESDGTSDPSGPGYDPDCGRSDSFTPSPPAGQWNQAYFEQLVDNSVDAPTTGPAVPTPTVFPSGGNRLSPNVQILRHCLHLIMVLHQSTVLVREMIWYDQTPAVSTPIFGLSAANSRPIT